MQGLVSIVQRFVSEESIAPPKPSTAPQTIAVDDSEADTVHEKSLDDVLGESEAAAAEILKYSTGTGTIQRFSSAREELALVIRQANLDELEQIGGSKAFEFMALGVNKDLPAHQLLLDQKMDSEFDGLVCFKWLLLSMLYRQPYEVSKDLLLDARLQRELLRVPVLFKAYIRYIFGALFNYVYVGEGEAHVRFYEEATKSMLALAHSCDVNDSNTFSQCFPESYPGYLPICNNNSLKELAGAFRELTTTMLHEHSANVGIQPLTASSEKSQKIRIGLLRYNLDVDVHGLLGPISRLDRSKFEIIVYAFDKYGLDQCRTRYADLTYQFLDLQDIIGAINKMRAAGLDILINGYALHWWSFEPPARMLLRRVAKIQCLWFADVITSGMKSFDYLLVGDAYKSLSLEEQFCEKPHFVPGIGYFMAGVTREAKLRSKARRELRLRQNEVIYLSTAHVLELCPEVLSAWMRILAAVESSRLVLMPFSHPALMDKYRRRLWRAIDKQCAETGVSRSRITMYDTNRSDLSQDLTDASDIFLDAFPCSGKPSTTEALMGGKPIVTLGGGTLRANVTAGVLRTLKLEDLIAKDVDDYIQKAVRLGNDQLFRTEVAGRVLEVSQDAIQLDLTLLTEGFQNALLEIVANHERAALDPISA